MRHKVACCQIDAVIERLHPEFGRRVFQLARRELRCAFAAEDVRNETLLRAIHALRKDGVRDLESLPAFVLGIARNVLREQRRVRKPSGDLSELDHLAEELDLIVDHTDRRALAMTLRRLSAREHAVIQLTFFEELTREEVAGRMDVPAERVRLLKSRALQTFRELYSKITGEKSRRERPIDAAMVKQQ